MTASALFAHPFSRITWTVTSPGRRRAADGGRLAPGRVGSAGDGAVFRIGVADGPTYTEFFKRMIHPQTKAEDRRWFPMEIDLSRYAGRK